MNVHYLTKVCAEFSTQKYSTKSTSTNTQSVFSEIASSEINHKLNQIYDDDDQTLYTQISARSKSLSEEMRIEQAWTHYIEQHKGLYRKNECKQGNKCPWVIHVKEHQKNASNTTSQHRSSQNLLAKCKDRKQLFHVYFYHKDEYDKAKHGDSRKERYVDNSEDCDSINIGPIVPPHGLNPISVTSPSIVSIHKHQNTASLNMDYQVSQMLPYGITKMETDVSNMSMSRLKNVEQYIEPGTPFNDTMGMDINGAYEIIGKTPTDMNLESNLGDINESSSVINIEMTTMNDCDDDESCQILTELLEYGSAENCNLPDVEPKYQPDGPSSTPSTKGDDDSDKFHIEEEARIKEYLHCITRHSKYKQSCKGKVCGYKQWKNNLQQTMRQMIHSAFYQHGDLGIEIVIEDEEHIQRTITVNEEPSQRRGSAYNGEAHMNTINEDEEESKDDEKAEMLTVNGVVKSSRLQPITYIPTQLEILKSQTKSINPSEDTETMTAKILQFGCPFTEKQPKFNNPKEEILNNDFNKITVKDWNDVLKKCVGLGKSIKAKSIKLNIKQLVALKLYTDLLSNFCLVSTYFLSIQTKPNIHIILVMISSVNYGNVSEK